MRPSSLGGGRAYCVALCPSVCPSVRPSRPVFSGPGNDVGHLEFNGCTGILRTLYGILLFLLQVVDIEVYDLRPTDLHFYCYYKYTGTHTEKPKPLRTTP